MELICESADLNKYLLALDTVDFNEPQIRVKSSELFESSKTEIEKIKAAFEFVRDEIAHSWDIQSTTVTCTASEVLSNGQGVCYAKSNLLAALLRSQDIPTGFCYQRLRLFGESENGYCVHAFNAVYLSHLKRWIRLDARGNKSGINAQFSLDNEKVAYTVKEEFGEEDYPVIYFAPHYRTIETLERNTDALKMCKHHLPEYL